MHRASVRPVSVANDPDLMLANPLCCYPGYV
jgi:hypothetical protein